ncbi:MAG: 16S rRNA (cytosine(1402)-N(4))-methyltransferase RsmH [Fimbriimonadaceae bacterium]|jgi:16S rRNA (cytosine1402-N4)-methyltransferase|nr:16S rRNA (cytosine(1402)-N(4))-methyltransferase RsmH [Fimbriimonadaceae bacterium]
MEGAHHVSVMAKEVLALLPLVPGATVVDGTLGLAGHGIEMLKLVQPGGLLVGLDWDKEMLEMARMRIEQEVPGGQVSLHHTDYRHLPNALDRATADRGRRSGAEAILLDLGLNNAQIEDEKRGISFRTEGPLDMRMDRSSGEPAAALLNRLAANQIEDILWNFGDERWARKIAQVIVERRKKTPLRTTQDLVDCVLAAIPAAKRDKRLHPATRTFQAVRIAVNHELEGLQEAIEQASHCLVEQGVIVVLSYHSGEDRATKLAFRSLAQTGEFEDLVKKPLVPSQEEIESNPKSRSCKLRALKRIA